MLGGYAMTAITAITAQNTLGVEAVHAIPTDMVLKQIDMVLADIGADAVKIGMIGSAETAAAVAGRLERLGDVPIIFDPVMVATSGSILADEATIAAFERLMKVATLVTPNAPELTVLSGHGAGEAEQGARALAARTGTAVLAKGGDVAGPRVVDLLVSGAEMIRWEDERIDTAHTHGTGCTLASAIATGIGAGLKLAEAVTRARLFVRVALREAPGFGAGDGPMGHQAVRLDVPPVGGPALNQVTLPASDYEASVGFYRLLGCRQIVASPPRYARFETDGGATLSIEVSDPVQPPTAAELFFECSNLDAFVERLVGSGLKFDVMPEDRSYRWRVAELRDPHGNRIRLYKAGEIRRFPPWRIG
jgi:hydroxymethylpyrimidine/phosphomethylpyrimidine kinase